MGSRKISSIIGVFLLVLFVPDHVHAQPEAGTDKQVFMVMVNGFSFLEEEIMRDFPGFSRWVNAGALGAMNLRTAGATNAVNNYVTIGSGVRSVGSDYAGGGYHGYEETEGGAKADAVFSRRTGKRLSDEQIAVLGVYHVIHNNEAQPYNSVPGLLGHSLAQQGKQTAVFGNLDMEDNALRYAPLVTMDRNGITSWGDVSQRTNRKASDFPGGVRTNYTFLLQQVKGVQNRPDIALAVFELGDLYRLYQHKKAMPGALFEEKKREVLRDIDRFLQKMWELKEESDLFLFVSPMVNEDAKEKDMLLAPVAMSGAGERGGILHSSTTRQEGIVANIDIAPTVLDWLAVPIPERMSGHSILSPPTAGEMVSVLRADSEKEGFRTELKQIFHVYASRPSVLYTYIIFQVIVLLLAALLWLKGDASEYNRIAVQTALLMLLLSPLLFLVAGAFPAALDGRTLLFVLIMTGALMAMGLKLLSIPAMFFLIGLANWLPVAADGLLGADWMQRSYLGYDPIIGARYYGIGNEYMGVVIGSSILCAAAVFQWKKTGVRLWEKMLTALLFFLLLMYFSSPRLGTNAGGAITAVFAYTVAYARMFRLRLTKKSIAWMLAVMASGLTMLLLANAWTENPTHIGEAFQALLAGNTSWILDIIQRKLEMNWRLFQVSSWNKVFITSLVILAAMFLRPKGALKALFERYPYLMNGVTGIVAGAFVTLFINDSGIVAAATAIIYGVVPLLYIIIQEKARHPHSRLSPVSLGKE